MISLTAASCQVKLILLLLLQGERVWLWEDEQYLPSAVSSCSGGVVVFATDYGQVRPDAARSEGRSLELHILYFLCPTVLGYWCSSVARRRPEVHTLKKTELYLHVVSSCDKPVSCDHD